MSYRILQLDPYFDIVGSRLPNHFVDRDPTTADSLAHLAALARGMNARTQR